MLFLKYIQQKLVPILFIVFIPMAGNAQFSLSGEFRPRTELRNGYKMLRTSQNNPAFFTSQRTRLNLVYKQDKYTFKLSGQDVRTWGEVDQLQDTPNVNIHEAWAQINFSKSLGIKLGRQELAYNDQRLLGSVNWAQQGRSHDVLMLKYKNQASGFSVDIGGAYNQEAQNVLGNTYSLSNYKMLSYVWLNKDFGKLDASGIFLTDGFEGSSGSVNYRYTYGTHINYHAKDLAISGTIYAQSGDDVNRNNIWGYMAAGKVSYDLSPIIITAGYDYLSGGDANDDNPRQHTFNTLYATNHKFYGHMDYFTNIPADTRGGGLQDAYAGIAFSASSTTSINFTYHHFSLANEIPSPINTNETLDTVLASEIDFSLEYNFSGDISFRLGYSALFENTSLKNLQQRQAKGLQQWGWVMLVLKPTFLDTN
jgi:hypothetical protein